jgi:hypothetical protein
MTAVPSQADRLHTQRRDSVTNKSLIMMVV